MESIMGLEFTLLLKKEFMRENGSMASQKEKALVLIFMEIGTLGDTAWTKNMG